MKLPVSLPFLAKQLNEDPMDYDKEMTCIHACYNLFIAIIETSKGCHNLSFCRGYDGFELNFCCHQFTASAVPWASEKERKEHCRQLIPAK